MIQFKCLKCGVQNTAHDSQAGQGYVCPQCGNLNQVPAAAPGEAPQAPPGAVPPPASPAPAQTAPMTAQQVNQWGMFCHLAALAGLVIPFGIVGGPLVVWLIKGKEHPFIDMNGKNALNFQITMAIASAVCIPLIFLFVGIFLIIAVSIFDLVMVILASLKANQGQVYKYPVSIPFIK